MLFDALERVWTVTNANFNTDLTALAGVKGVTGFSAVILKRQTAEMIVAKNATQPTIGIYAIRALTQSSEQGKRDSLCTVGADLVITGSDPALVQKQVELGAEVLVREMTDRVPTGAATTYGAGVERLSVTVEISDGYTEGQAPNYIGIASVTVPVWDRD